MLYFLIVFLALVLLWIFLIWVRKTMWDAVHRNLLDLEEKLDGRVSRASFGSRPVFRGSFNGREITINFSTEKKAKKRLTYVDISFDFPLKHSFSIAKKSWLENQQAGPIEDFTEWIALDGQSLVLRPASTAVVQKIIRDKTIQEALETYSDLAYLFAGQSGLLYEFITDEVIKSTEADALIKRLNMLETIGKALIS